MKRATIITLLVILALAGIVFLARGPLIRAVLPKVEKVAAGNITIIGDSARVSFGLVIRNRGWVVYDLRSVNIEIRNDSLLLVQYSSLEQYVLEKGETKTIPLEVIIPFRSAIARIRDLQYLDSTTLTFHGMLTFATWAGDMEVEVNELFTVEVPIPPTIRVQEIQYVPDGNRKNADDEKLYNFRVRTSIVNLNKKKFEFHDVGYDFYGGELIESHGTLGDLVIAPLDTMELWITMPVQLNNKAALVYRLMTDNDVIDYTLQMRGTIISVAGIDQEIPTTLSTGGRIELIDPERKKIPVTIRRKKNARKK